jgi:hypothetical protein
MPAMSRSTRSARHGAQGLALEVEQHPAARGRLQGLSEVQVAVDALQARPGQRLGRVVHGEHRLLVLGDLGHLAGRDRDASPHAGEGLGDGRVVGGHRAELLGEGGVHLGDGRAQLAGRGGEVGAGGGGVEGDAPGVLGPGEELLREREVAPCLAAVATRVGPRGVQGAERGGHAGRAALGEGRLRGDVGVVAVVQHPEHLGDGVLHGPALHVVDDRRVRLLALQDAGAAHPAGLDERRPVDDDVGALDVGLRRHQLEEVTGVGRVVRGVVEVEVVGRADERRVAAGQRGAAGDHGHLVEHGQLGRLVDDEQRDREHPVEVGLERPDHPDRGRAALRGVPALSRHPSGKGRRDVAHEPTLRPAAASESAGLQLRA